MIDIHAEAERHADRVAPWPKHEPIFAGMVGGMSAYLGLLVFSVLADLREHQIGWQVNIMAAAAFLIPFGLGQLQQRRHGRAYVEEYKRLKAESDHRAAADRLLEPA